MATVRARNPAKLKAARRASGKTLTVIGARHNVAGSTIGNVINGRYPCREDIARWICMELNVDYDEHFVSSETTKLYSFTTDELRALLSRAMVKGSQLQPGNRHIDVANQMIGELQ